MDVESGYLPIQSLDIEAESKITFDLYVNLPLNQKYLLYRKKGGVLATSNLVKFSTGNVKNFFIHKDDYNEFVKYVAVRIKSLVGKETGSEESKKVMTAAAKAILSSTFAEADPAMTGALISNLNDITSMIIDSALESSKKYNKETFKKFCELAKRGTDYQKHPVNVTSLAVLMTLGLGYNNEKILSDMAMAGLLHDIGTSKLSPSVIAKAHSPEQLNYVERAGLYRHPEYTLQILKEKKVKASPFFETLVIQHHEEFNGFGYPRGVRGFNLNELAQVLRVADELDHLICSGYSSTSESKVSVTELMDRLHRDKVIEPTLCHRLRHLLV